MKKTHFKKLVLFSLMSLLLFQVGCASLIKKEKEALGTKKKKKGLAGLIGGPLKSLSDDKDKKK